ncbi:MAG: hypothetical protein AUI99_03410 [Gemmatimonadetes bacterium 13_1_40CM_3_69_22]|nr:MAG: hypothetical protein AUI99_03410 [Gemmatimonadetes bacterium 13_1_40CM_3_69_22]
MGDRVRRLVVGAAIIVAACGGPPETPVPVAAPGSAGAAAPAPIRPFLESHEQYYDIEGSTTGALREQMHRLGPRDGDAARDALTVWTIDWTYAEARTADGCGLRDVKVTLTLSTTLPRWVPAAGTPAHVVDSWKTYFQHVRQHEAGHRAIAEQNARDLLAALSSMRAATCQQVMDAASRTGERIVAEGRAKNRAYDVQTKHGQTQGVVLPP